MSLLRCCAQRRGGIGWLARSNFRTSNAFPVRDSQFSTHAAATGRNAEQVSIRELLFHRQALSTLKQVLPANLNSSGAATLLVPRRGLASESLSERLKAATESLKSKTGDLKQTVLARPKSLLDSAKQSEFMLGTKGAVSALSKPLNKTFMSYREALKLQVEAFWRRNYLVLVGAAGLATCLLLWKIMFGFASMFVTLSEGMAKYGFLALAASTVGFGAMLLKARYTINPEAVYRIAMRRLNTSAPVLKALGAPLSGTEIRAYVMTGGGLRIKNFKPRLSNKRCFLIFPIQGSEKKGLVSIETKKRDGQYDFKLLAVDVAGEVDRIYVVGDEVEYTVGGGLISELRDPIVKAMAAQTEFEAQDDKDDEDEQVAKRSSL